VAAALASLRVAYAPELMLEEGYSVDLSLP
jgi:hypothetical protein